MLSEEFSQLEGALRDAGESVRAGATSTIMPINQHRLMAPGDIEDIYPE